MRWVALQSRSGGGTDGIEPIEPGDVDHFEPDDAIPHAAPIACGETQARSIAPPGDQDWLAFTLAQPSQVQVDVDTAGFPLVTAFDDASVLLANGFPDLDFLCGAKALPAGSYRLRLSGPSTFAYDLTLLCSPCLTPNPTPASLPTSTRSPTPLDG